MKTRLTDIVLTVLVLCAFQCARAQINIMITTPNGAVIAYSLSIGHNKFPCDKDGVVKLSAAQYALLKDKKVSFTITDAINRDFYDELSLCTTVDCCYAIGGRGSITIFGLTLQKLTANNVSRFYFHLNHFGEMQMPIQPTRSG